MGKVNPAERDTCTALCSAFAEGLAACVRRAGVLSRCHSCTGTAGLCSRHHCGQLCSRSQRRCRTLVAEMQKQTDELGEQ